jgi:N-acetylglucosamine malate deacetylase 1
VNETVRVFNIYQLEKVFLRLDTINKMVILVLAAHPDDEVLGCGGTIAKYAKQGEDIVSVIFSDGNPIKSSKDFIVKRRKESIAASKILGVSDTVFLGLPDNPFNHNISSKKIKDRVQKIITKLKPRLIFTHSPDDPHPAHIAISKLATEINSETKADIYMFAIGNPFKLKQRDKPRMYIDISDTFEIKRKALQEFKSQEHILLYYKILSYMSSKISGLHSRHTYAEVFYKC